MHLIDGTSLHDDEFFIFSNNNNYRRVLVFLSISLFLLVIANR